MEALIIDFYLNVTLFIYKFDKEATFHRNGQDRMVSYIRRQNERKSCFRLYF